MCLLAFFQAVHRKHIHKPVMSDCHELSNSLKSLDLTCGENCCYGKDMFSFKHDK